MSYFVFNSIHIYFLFVSFFLPFYTWYPALLSVWPSIPWKKHWFGVYIFDEATNILTKNSDLELWLRICHEYHLYLVLYTLLPVHLYLVLYTLPPVHLYLVWYSIHSYPSIYTWYSKHSSDPSIYTWYSIQSSYSSNYTWYSKHSSDPSFSSCKTSTDGSILTPDLCVIKNMVRLESNLEIKTYPITPGLPTTKRGIQENTRREDWEKNKSSTLLLSMGTLSKLRYRGFINIPPPPPHS